MQKRFFVYISTSNIGEQRIKDIIFWLVLVFGVDNTVLSREQIITLHRANSSL